MIIQIVEIPERKMFKWEALVAGESTHQFRTTTLEKMLESLSAHLIIHKTMK